jgi:hypothetical protein
LRWNPNNLEKIAYKAAMEADVTDILKGIQADEMISEPFRLDRAISALKKIPLDDKYMHYRSRFQSRNNGESIRARLIGVPIKFEGEPADEKEAQMRELIKMYTHAIRLQGDMDLSGDSADLTFYRAPKERNIMTQFFYLPKDDVNVGDYWSLPVTFFIELGPGIYEQTGKKHNRVKLHSLTNSTNGLVAELHYLVSESVEGYAERVVGTSNDPVPFKLNITIYGYGEFLVEKGYWQRQVTVIDYTASGYTDAHKKHLFALALEESGE